MSRSSWVSLYAGSNRGQREPLEVSAFQAPGRPVTLTKIFTHMERELAQLSSTIREAGQRAMDLARKGFEIQTKKDRSPVTTADLEVNRILREMQEPASPTTDGFPRSRRTIRPG